MFWIVFYFWCSDLLLWNNGLREAVVNRDFFVFEHLICSSAMTILYAHFYTVNTFLLKVA